MLIGTMYGLSIWLGAMGGLAIGVTGILYVFVSPLVANDIELKKSQLSSWAFYYCSDLVFQDIVGTEIVDS